MADLPTLLDRVIDDIECGESLGFPSYARKDLLPLMYLIRDLYHRESFARPLEDPTSAEPKKE